MFDLGTLSPVLALGNEDEYKVCRSVARKHWDTMKTHYQKVTFYSLSILVCFLRHCLSEAKFLVIISCGNINLFRVWANYRLRWHIQEGNELMLLNFLKRYGIAIKGVLTTIS